MAAKKKKVGQNNQRWEKKGYYFGDICISDINKWLKDLIDTSDKNQDMGNLAFAIPTSMVVALNLCQIRQSLPGLNSQKVEQLDSYRHKKKNIL
jgi:hypothetical protein